MKRIFLIFIVFSAAAVFAQTTGTSLYVAVKSVEVKNSTGFFARISGSLSQGEQVTLVRQNGKWVNIRTAAGLQGWAPGCAFSSRRIVNSGAGVSADEFAMAGKGFTGDLEQLLKSSDGVNYSPVDAMEGRAVNPDELRGFLRDGRLALGE